MPECYRSTGELEEALEKSLAQINASRWAHEPGEGLRASEVPFDFLADANELGHLLFDVFVREAQTQGEAGPMEVDGVLANWTAQTWVVLVETTYEVRDEHQRADARAAGDLTEKQARALVRGADNRRVRGWRRRPARVGGLGPGPALGVPGWLRLSLELEVDVLWPDEEVSCECA